MWISQTHVLYSRVKYELLRDSEIAEIRAASAEQCVYSIRFAHGLRRCLARRLNVATRSVGLVRRECTKSVSSDRAYILLEAPVLARSDKLCRDARKTFLARAKASRGCARARAAPLKRRVSLCLITHAAYAKRQP